ncbi:LytTR family DNA-binding domain-containing protein [Dyadobacter chenwenxiniae]|uniref:LytTR family DNA-binding domain-containing protein n=1 Tax=Dyadobacter chenwenxiniae TaxID=2906456 RepID=A0A9X1TIV0_9BACT|nr:LytTR family DNA-binding domain-containing protein [Dyadobacter chenwenxiniae]MCF0065844.1 LytTR family DNA-binding domain-containing protein [Dyadobacter chenwenxiniae]UON84090.1 LytTR family DNA-binding domain-containing protein [Dyadobacter chenwenxiniae]
MMKAIIIEDESLVARELQRKIAIVASDIMVVKVLFSLEESIAWLKGNPHPDLMFMDIQLGDGVSFELMEHVKINCPVIFTTAYDEYAIRAFKVNGVDYLLKPVDETELKKATDKCRALLGDSYYLQSNLHQLLHAFAHPSQTEYKKKFLVCMRNQWIPVSTDDIACFAKDNIHFLYTLKGDRHVVDFTTMDEIEELLDPKKFFRANRQFIINIEAIHGIRMHENQKLTVALKSPLTMELDISREKAPAFKKWFDI